MSGVSDCGQAETTAERALSALLRGVALLASVVCLFFAITLLAGVGGYALRGWIGAFTGLGIAWVVIGASLAVVGRAAGAKARTSSVTVAASPVVIAQPVVGAPISPSPGPAPQDEFCEEEPGPDPASRITLPLAALALGAAAVIGPVRALRMGLKLYTVWSGISRMMSQSEMSPRPRGRP